VCCVDDATDELLTSCSLVAANVHVTAPRLRGIASARDAPCGFSTLDYAWNLFFAAVHERHFRAGNPATRLDVMGQPERCDSLAARDMVVQGGRMLSEGAHAQKSKTLRSDLERSTPLQSNQHRVMLMDYLPGTACSNNALCDVEW